MPCFVFDADDVSFGGDRAIVAKGARRFMFSSLTVEQIAMLRKLMRDRSIPWGGQEDPLVRAMRSKDIVREGDASASAISIGRSRLLPSSAVSSVSRLLSPLSGWMVMGCMIALTAAAFGSGAVAPVMLFSVTSWLKSVTAADFLIACSVFAGCIMVHEMGHAAACMRRTGMVGGIRASFYRGIPVFTTDVSSLCLATPRGRATIAVAGVVFQLACSALLLLVPVESVRVGATLSLLSAGFALVPLPGADGYWFLSDLLQRRIVGPFGASQDRSVIGYAYMAWLLPATFYFCYVILRDASSLLVAGWAMRETAVAWSTLFVSFGLYAGIVSALFLRRSLSFLKTGECGMR